jgi:sigma-54 dependent transcriptional regulator, acetoin dehydrogenase operon transcriptional activator AcoR
VICVVKRIVVFAMSEEAFGLIERQLADLFPGLVRVERFSGDLCFDDYDLLVATHQHESFHPFPKERIILAKRTLPITFIEKLLQIPAETTCYVASNTIEASMESILMLQQFGIQLKMLPYPTHEEKMDPEIRTVITHHKHLIAENKFARVIEIGIRPLDFTTIVDIAVGLQLPLHTHSVYKATNIEEIVRLNISLSDSIQQVNNLYQQVEAIINTSKDGILTLNSEGIMIQVNSALLEVLKNKPSELIGKEFSKLFPAFELLTQNDHYLYSLNTVQFVVQQLPITLVDGEVGTLIIFQEVKKLQRTEQEVRRKILAPGFVSKYQFSDIVGSSPRLQATIEKAKKLAVFDQPILILGENGTGKELFAHSLHHLSARKDQPFVPVNFASLPETLAESELFGYEEGAFTGAKRGGKPGFFELAHQGTIFLDEIGDAPPSIQASLLRVLQEKQILRVGGTQLLPVNVRIIAATNKNLEELVAQGKFREDLFYRLNVLPLPIPSLKERKEDILALLRYFFLKLTPKNVDFSAEVEELLTEYSWPGNIRELENTVYYLSAIMQDDEIRVEDLPPKFMRKSNRTEQSDVLRQLEAEGSLADFAQILSYLDTARKQNWPTGRNAIATYFQHNNQTSLSPEQIKNRMAILKKYQLIGIGSTRQGSWITTVGIEALKAIRVN